MRLRHVVALALVALPMRSLAAQSAQCAAQPIAVRDACQKGTDLFLMLAPQVAGALTGGGALLGTAGTSGGLSLSLRLNAVEGQIPTVSAVPLSANGFVRSTIATTRAPVPMPTLDATFSLIPGFRAGRQRVLSVDALVSVVYVPSTDLESFSVRTSTGAFKTGYGVRVGLLADSRTMPAVSVSYLRRTLPTTTIATSIPINVNASTIRDTIAISELSLRADAMRASISKRFGFLEIGGGAGQDRYRNFTQLRTRVTPVVLGAPLAPISSAYVVTQSLTRSAAYGSLAVHVGRFHVGAEVGSSFGGDSVSTYNTFIDGKQNAARRFGSVGLRVSF